LGAAVAGGAASTYIAGLRTGFVEVMSMMGVTPASAYCGAKLAEAIGLDPAFVAREMPGVATHLGGIGPDVLGREWLDFHAAAFGAEAAAPREVGEFRYRREGRPHLHSPAAVRTLHAAVGHVRKHGSERHSAEDY